jgi:hypothetical protein
MLVSESRSRCKIGFSVGEAPRCPRTLGCSWAKADYHRERITTILEELQAEVYQILVAFMMTLPGALTMHH